MDLLAAYLPADRLHALAGGATLPSRARGTVLFADISGFTPLTEALVRTLGPRRGAEELARQLNEVYDALIAQVDRYGGSVQNRVRFVVESGWQRRFGWRLRHPWGPAPGRLRSDQRDRALRHLR